MSVSLDYKGKCGEGAYGVVYEAKMTTVSNDQTKTQKVAIKRNYGEVDTKGISCIREMNFLASLNHPCIIRLKSISVGDPFEKVKPWTPKPRRQDMKEDTHHFVMEYSDYELDKFIETSNNYHQYKTVMCQLLLGMEFFHSKGIVHRDIKPPNVLVSMKQNVPYGKFCDFGLSRYSSKFRPSTPGTVTSWYRAPEICCEYEDYDFSSDVWSLGCVFYEMVSSEPFITTKRDNDKKIFNDILKKLPDNFTLEYLQNYVKQGNSTFKVDTQRKKNINFENYFKSRVNVRDFNKKGGSILEFCDLLKGMLKLEPSERLTATECLNHPFFKSFEGFTRDMRKTYPPVKNTKTTINVIDCIERKWAVNVVFDIYNRREKIKWYSHDIIFQALRIFDDYLKLDYDKNKQEREVTKNTGKLLTKYETHIRIYTCIYIMYKYFSTLQEFYSWASIFPSNIVSSRDKSLLEIIDFEKYVIRNVCKYVVYKPLFLDLLNDEDEFNDTDEDEFDVKVFLTNYGNINSYEGTVKDLYDLIRKNCY